MGSSILQNVVLQQTPQSIRGRVSSATRIGPQSSGLLVTAADPDEVNIFGEVFSAVEDGDTIVLTHPQWSLVGFGRTHVDAYKALMQEAAELANEMQHDDPAALSPQARRLREYVLRIV